MAIGPSPRDRAGQATAMPGAGLSNRRNRRHSAYALVDPGAVWVRSVLEVVEPVETPDLNRCGTGLQADRTERDHPCAGHGPAGRVTDRDGADRGETLDVGRHVYRVAEHRVVTLGVVPEHPDHRGAGVDAYSEAGPERVRRRHVRGRIPQAERGARRPGRV